MTGGTDLNSMVSSAEPGAPLAARTRVRRASGLAVGMTSLFALWLALNLGGDTVVLWIDDVGTAVAALVACVLCVVAARRHDGDLRRSWWLLAGACGAWTLGEVIWGVYELVLEEAVPSPSWADAAYLVAVPLAVAALLSHPMMHAETTRKVRAGLDGLAVATALFFLSWALLLGPLLRSSDVTTLGGWVSLAYPFGDVVLIFFVALIVRRIDRRERLVAWCLLAGLLAMAVSDSVYAYLSEVRGFETGNVMDTGWVGAYAAIALGAYFSSATASSAAPLESAEPTPATFLAPFLPILAALTVATVALQLGDRLDRVAWTAGLTLVLLVLARQALLLVEVIGPRREHGVEMSARLVAALSDARTDREPAESATGSPR